MLRHVVRLAVAALVVAAAGVVVPTPAQAATCSTASGVSVVVDFHQLGGGVQTFCDTSGAGEYADAQFADAGHTLTYVQQQPGFVCRVDGVPSSDPCVRTPPSTAYWSLWWSDGKSGTWTYSSTGVQSLKVPAGGYVALSWQKGTGKATPGAPATAHAPSSPTSGPTHAPTRHPTAPTQAPTSTTPTTGSSSSPASAPTSTAPTGGPTSTGSHRPRSHHSQRHHAGRNGHHATDSPSATPEAGGPVAAVSSRRGDDEDGSGGLPGWVAPVAVLLVFALGGGVTLLRRKRSGGA